MISVFYAISTHALQIARYGGANGLRDRGGLEAALARPFHGFGEQDAYPGPIEKSAALLHSLAKNHPFVDGNKRIAFVLALYLLEGYGYQLKAEVSNDNRYEMVIAVASGNLEYEGIVEWLRQNTEPIKSFPVTSIDKSPQL